MDIDEYEQLMDLVMGFGDCEATCPECGHCQTVEPDADYPCPECGEGRLQSPLIERGLI